MRLFGSIDLTRACRSTGWHWWFRSFTKRGAKRCHGIGVPDVGRPMCSIFKPLRSTAKSSSVQYRLLGMPAEKLVRAHGGACQDESARIACHSTGMLLRNAAS